MTLKVSLILCYSTMSYDPITGKLPNIDPVKISTAIVNSPVGNFTAHVSQLAMTKLVQLTSGGSKIDIQNYRVGDKDIFNIW